MPNRQKRYRRASADLDRLARAAARLLLEEGRTADDVASELGLKDAREVGVLVKRAKDRELVRIQVSDAARESPQMNDRLGRALELKLRLRGSLVVRPNAQSEHDDDSEFQSQLHDDLGRVAARHLLTIVRRRDTIAVCAGRGVGYTIEHVRQTPRLEGHPAFSGEGPVLSLAGGVFLPAWTDGPGLQYLDNADYNAHRLSDALRRPAKLCCGRAYRPDENSRDEAIERDAKHFKDGTPIDIALYGAGVVDSSHYLQRITDDPQADAISELRKDLRALTDHQATRAVVIDHCEHFYVSPATPRQHRGVVNEIVRELNKLIVAIDPQRIKDVPERMLVAGGKNKLPALLPLVSDDWEGPRPTILVTDEQTAEALLDA